MAGGTELCNSTKGSGIILFRSVSKGGNAKYQAGDKYGFFQVQSFSLTYKKVLY